MRSAIRAHRGGRLACPVPASVVAASLAVACLAVASLAACTPADHQDSSLAWSSCGSTVDTKALGVPVEQMARLDLSCAGLTVPLDRTGATSGEVEVRLLRISRRSDEARPPLLLIAGGPGQSGVDNAAVLVGWLPGEILDSFDVIGFDPRGVGRSDPIACVGRRPETPILDLSTDAGYAAATTVARSWAQECSTTLGERARHYSTTATAEDIEAIRFALGVDRLRYVGWSYGAKLGAEYARLHADRVEAAVLDAPTDPDVAWTEMIRRQVDGFESAFGRFADWCEGRSECAALGDVRAFVPALVRRAEQSPITSLRRSDLTGTTGSDVVDGVVAALYDDARWPDLAATLTESAAGDSGGLRALAEATVRPRPEGDEPPDTQAQAQYVINCNDTDDDPTEVEVRTAAARLVRDDPTFGAWGSFNLLGCAFWDVPRTPLPPSSAATPRPLLVVGTRHDPATPYVGAERMTDLLGHAVLLSWEGEGHTAFGRSRCIGEYVVDYLVDLRVPAVGTTCPAGA
ncbi:alpha/beta hydrolase [Knoellia locipacati]|uniref:Alpha/beta hydrolase n=1 Tax=Knoellia locipacati TaxID=882824 RepID=A0A512T076_9MICO|nr:alpha/beta hydrolase [Knoellia locipacati]GEQ13583.1 alpha/beta hydrolase [Knoellia locipacati]